MNPFQEIQPMELSGKLLSEIGSRWMLVAAENAGRVNMLTASWGGLGVLWNKPVATIYIRPQRYTLELLNAADGFSLSFFTEAYRLQYNLCGTKSGREIDKVDACGFTVLHEESIPYFMEADRAVFCKKLYRQQLAPECFIDKAPDKANYPNADYHYMFIGEITKVLERQG